MSLMKKSRESFRSGNARNGGLLTSRSEGTANPACNLMGSLAVSSIFSWRTLAVARKKK